MAVTPVRVVVLGASGMLGGMVARVLAADPGFKVTPTERQTKLPGAVVFDGVSFMRDGIWPKALVADYVINCIGIIKPFCRDDDARGVALATEFNARFPQRLAEALPVGTRLLQIATDCVFSGATGGYDEASPHDAHDVYGKTKSLGEVRSANALHIRCSIVGPEWTGKAVSLLGWCLAQGKADIPGFPHHFWNGVTTLQFARLCQKIIAGDHFAALRAEHHVHHFVPNEVVSKQRLLEMFVSAFATGARVVPKATGVPAIDRTLKTRFKSLEKLFPGEGQAKAVAELAAWKKAHP